MTEEDFLKRWSRRKREADLAKAAPPDAERRDAAAPDQAISSKREDAPQAEFDPASLPPIESINAITDVTAFLRDGVPVELTRAALRRVWTADPAIRDFVGLSENAWDFTDPHAMPGFGPLESTEDVRQLIARVVDQIGEAARSQAAEAESPHDSNTLDVRERGEQVASGPLPANERIPDEVREQVLVQSNKEDDAAQRDVAEDVTEARQSSHRGHGGALPR